MTFLRAHWPIFAALALGLCLGWVLFHPREAAVHEKLDEHAKVSDIAAQDTRADVGGWTRETFEFAPNGAPGGCSPNRRIPAQAPGIPADEVITNGAPALSAIIVERHDPTVIASHRTDVEQAEQDRHLDLTVKPAADPRWAVQVGVEDVLGARSLRLAGRIKVFGPFWAEVSAVPMARTLGVGLAVEW